VHNQHCWRQELCCVPSTSAVGALHSTEAWWPVMPCKCSWSPMAHNGSRECEGYTERLSLGMLGRWKLPGHLRMANLDGLAMDQPGQPLTQAPGEGIPHACINQMDASLTWPFVAWLRSICSLPVFVKAPVSLPRASLHACMTKFGASQRYRILMRQPCSAGRPQGLGRGERSGRWGSRRHRFQPWRPAAGWFAVLDSW
jgi:hypothetical protein